MDINVSTPSLLFPAISLLLLAYTNRFVTLTSVIRTLNHMEDDRTHDASAKQITSLVKRLQLIRWMQSFGVMSFVVCTLSMLAIFFSFSFLGNALFAFSLFLLVLSLLCSLYEVQISTTAITIEISQFDNKPKMRRKDDKRYEENSDV